MSLFGPTGSFLFPLDRPAITSTDNSDGEAQEMFFSANWVDLRTRFSFNSAAIRYLQFQGMKGLVGGQSIWSVNPAGISFPNRDRTQRLNSWAPSGTARISLLNDGSTLTYVLSTDQVISNLAVNRLQVWTEAF